MASHTLPRTVALDRRVVGPSLVPIFVDPTTATQRVEPDCTLHLWADCTLREACELLWARDGADGSAAELARAQALELSLIYPGVPQLPRSLPSLHA